MMIHFAESDDQKYSPHPNLMELSSYMSETSEYSCINVAH